MLGGLGGVVGVEKPGRGAARDRAAGPGGRIMLPGREASRMAGRDASGG